jgi:energy-coupling factor transporter ATP-binding protein EcfA2
MLISTHDMRLVAELFKRTIVLDRGEVVYDGDTDQLLADDPFLLRHGLEAP